MRTGGKERSPGAGLCRAFPSANVSVLIFVQLGARAPSYDTPCAVTSSEGVRTGAMCPGTESTTLSPLSQAERSRCGEPAPLHAVCGFRRVARVEGHEQE